MHPRLGFAILDRPASALNIKRVTTVHNFLIRTFDSYPRSKIIRSYDLPLAPGENISADEPQITQRQMAYPKQVLDSMLHC